ncbi:C1 family peptidase [Archangium sp. Cb G35]|uniref:C1 family peptidase n=1 Tax=Archangium sp. Cb G35 TaxID=1920190 RepID=UPI0011613951|nr:C1 family peptidase [Archangium sp. Cb G35]
MRVAQPFLPYDQGDVPCCVSMAIVGAMESLLLAAGNPVQLSPLHHYWHARPLPPAITLVDPRHGLQVARTIGVAPLAVHLPAIDPYLPLTPVVAAERPSSTVDFAAASFRLQVLPWQYLRVPPGQQARRWKAALARGVPVMVGLDIPPGYERLFDGEDVLQPGMGPAVDKHVVLVVGWSQGTFLVRDSRGDRIGKAGHWWLPERLADSSLVVESWVIDPQARADVA